jgi:hypothetical protein
MFEDHGPYEHKGVYVDDLLIADRDPEKAVKTLRDANKLKPKNVRDANKLKPTNVGPLAYHLGYNYFHDKDGTLSSVLRNYVSNMV